VQTGEQFKGFGGGVDSPEIHTVTEFRASLGEIFHDDDALLGLAGGIKPSRMFDGEFG
jgi:hypothetical protein